MIELRRDGEALLVPVKVVPGASRTRWLGEWDGRVRIAVAAPPEGGKANRELAAFLARSLGLRRKQVTVHAGSANPLKIIRIEGTPLEEISQRLIAACK